MKKIVFALLLVPSVVLAHPGHDGHADASREALITNPALIIALFIGISLAFSRVARMVRK